MYSISLPSYYSKGKGFKYLKRCLKTMQETIGSHINEVELCIYLQMYPEEDAQTILDMTKGFNVKFKSVDYMAGLVGAHNECYKMCSNDIVLNIDDDFVFQPGSFEYYHKIYIMMEKEKSFGVIACVQNTHHKEFKLYLQTAKAFWKSGGLMMRLSAYPDKKVLPPELPCREDAYSGFYAYTLGYVLARVEGCPTLHKRHRRKANTPENGRGEFSPEQWEKLLPGMTIFRRREAEPEGTARAWGMSFSKECKLLHKEKMNELFGYNDIDNPERYLSLVDKLFKE